MANVYVTGNVSQSLIDTMLEAFRNGDNNAADMLWDLQEFMTPEQCATTKAKVQAIIDKNECPHCGVVRPHPAGNVQCPSCGGWANYAHASDR